MNDEVITKKINEAIKLTQDFQEPYKSIAFKIVLKKLLEVETPPTITTRESNTSLAVIKTQANEFLASLATRSQLDLFEGVAYYFLHSGQKGVTRTEFLETLSKARLARPKNISDVLGRCIRRGHIIEATEDKEGQKAYHITPTGEKYIEEKIKSQ